MLTVAQHGSLAVAWSEADKYAVGRELARLSPDLFLDPEMDPDWGVFWTVKHNIGSGHPPVTCVVWRQPDGRPLPLSFGIVEQVKRQEGRADGLVKQVVAENDRREQKLHAESREALEEMHREHLPRIKAAAGRTLPPFHRPRRFGVGA